MAGGRPPKYNLEIAKKICKAIAISTDSIPEIIKKNPDFPCEETIRAWKYDHLEFSGLYAQAKRDQADLLAEQITELAKDTSNDFYINGKGESVPNPVNVQRMRLIIDTQKWIACKLLPKVYGDNNKEQSEDRDNLKEALEAIKEIAKKCIQPI